MIHLVKFELLKANLASISLLVCLIEAHSVLVMRAAKHHMFLSVDAGTRHLRTLNGRLRIKVLLGRNSWSLVVHLQMINNVNVVARRHHVHGIHLFVILATESF